MIMEKVSYGSVDVYGSVNDMSLSCDISQKSVENKILVKKIQVLQDLIGQLLLTWPVDHT